VFAIEHGAIDRASRCRGRRDCPGHRKPHVAAVVARSDQRHKAVLRAMSVTARHDKESVVASYSVRLEEGRRSVA